MQYLPQELDALLREILEESAIGVFVLDASFHVVAINAAVETYFGIRREDVRGKDKRTLIQDRIKHIFDDPDHFATTVLATYDNNTYAEHFECHILPADGRQERWLEHQSRPILTGPLAGGRIEHYYDVTDMHVAKNRLSRAAMDWQSTFDTIGEAVCILDLTGHAQQCNASMLRLTGLSAEEIRGKPCWVLMHDTDRRPPDCPVHIMLETGERSVQQLEWHQRHFTVTVDPLQDPDGKITRLVHVMRDVTEERLAAEKIEAHMKELAANEIRFRRLYSQSPIGIELFDSEGKLMDANPACLRLFGIDDVTAVRGFDLFADPDVPGSAISDLRKGISVKFESTFDFERVKREGLYPTSRSGRMEIDCQISPLLSATSDVEGYLVYVRDITERRKSERERESMLVKLEEAKKQESLTVLAGGIAHDFNNLLFGILGNAELALSDLPDDHPCRESIESAMVAARQAAALSKQMLAYSGKGRFVSERQDLIQLLNEALVQQISSLENHTQIQLRREFSDNLPPVSGDADQILELLRCLIANAYEAMQEEGILKVRVGSRNYTSGALSGNRTQDHLKPGTYVFVEIGDTGWGIAETDLERIFDPFYSTKFVGRGLGLSVVLGVVRAHGGGVFVESQVGKGTTARVLFPAVVDDETHPPTPFGKDADMVRGKTVLLVDDEKHVRHVAGNMLKRHGLTVLVACNGREALETLHQHAEEIGCVVLDLTMPILGGEETYRRIRRAGLDVPVVLSSGYDELEATQRFDMSDLAGFLQKPYSRDELLGIVSRALRG